MNQSRLCMKLNVFCGTLPEKYIIVVMTYPTEVCRCWARKIQALTSKYVVLTGVRKEVEKEGRVAWKLMLRQKN